MAELVTSVLSSCDAWEKAVHYDQQLRSGELSRIAQAKQRALRGNDRAAVEKLEALVRYVGIDLARHELQLGRIAETRAYFS